ncbi:helix-turn-helix DNA binding domain protein [Arthrobacter phage Sonali]|uniref:Helix-turn-helix DNA binding domain protein n=1 Tax=Arthrobacter phage Sonali TaxID=2510495 RepID=A0A411CQU3_9CAUD|nr:helix-turn-helix DNA binding domain protein [Arthrobacter phage Sonali]QAY16177.1 helix-turn-helix DNA binding domain protein [Arthrobacter phage Sonali]
MSKPRGRGKATDDRRGLFLRLNAEGLSLDLMAERLGVTVRTISRYREEYGLSQAHPGQNFRPTEEWIAEVRALAEEGMPIAEICRMKGTTWATIKRNVPDIQVWDASTVGKHGAAVRHTNRALRRQGHQSLASSKLA